MRAAVQVGHDREQPARGLRVGRARAGLGHQRLDEVGVVVQELVQRRGVGRRPETHETLDELGAHAAALDVSRTNSRMT